MKPILILSALLWALACPAGAMAEKEEEFESGFKKVRSLMARGKWSSAEKELNGLLAEHRDENYVRVKRNEIEDCLKTCAFRKSYVPPAPKKLVSGDLLSYNGRTGAIKIRYDGAKMGDFESSAEDSGKSYVHPALFTGPYTVEVKGEAYPGPNRAGTAFVRVCIGEGCAFSINYGFKSITLGSQVQWMPARMSLWNGTDWVEKDAKETSPAEPNVPFHLKVKVAGNRVSAYFRNKLLLKASKPKGEWGYFGFKGFDFDEILIQGKIQPSWIQGLQDAVAQEARDEFETGWVAAEKLPDWLLKPKKETASREPAAAGSGHDRRRYPGERRDDLDFIMDKAVDFYNSDDFEGGLEFVRSLGDDEIPEVFGAYLLALFVEAAGDPQTALVHCGRACKLDSSFFGTRRMEATLLFDLGEKKKALAKMRSLLEDFPDVEVVHTDLAWQLFLAGRPDDAKTVIDNAVRKGIAIDNMEDLNRQLAKALNGPNWARIYEYESKHYHVFSDIDRETCFQASKLLEDSYTAYTVYLKWIKDLEKKKFRVYLFSGQAGFMAYCEDLQSTAQSWAAGCYMPMLQQLLIWNLPDRAAMMRTVRHEGFHQYLDRIMVDPPSWLNEGLAEYYEITRREGGRWNFGKIHKSHLRELTEPDARLVPLDRFLYQGAKEFYADPDLHYSQSWAFVHFLRHGPRKYRQYFERVFDGLQGELSAREVLDSVFGDVDLDRLQNEFEAYVNELG